MIFEELKQEFKDRGFIIEGNVFKKEMEDPHTIINGRHPIRIFKMEYISPVFLKDVDDSDVEDLYQFDILDQNGSPAITICIRDYDDFEGLV